MDDETTSQNEAPGSQSLRIVPQTIAPPAADEVVEMLVEQVRFSDEPETRAVAIRLLEASDLALHALVEVAGDAGAAPRDRVKAAESILDRCGITPETAVTGESRAIVAVDIDFDERLARIVAGSGAQVVKSE